MTCVECRHVPCGVQNVIIEVSKLIRHSVNAEQEHENEARVTHP